MAAKIALGLCLLLLVGCSGGGSNASNGTNSGTNNGANNGSGNSNPVALTGSWHAVSQSAVSGQTYIADMFIAQSGSNLINVRNIIFTNACAQYGNLQGTIKGNQVNLTITELSGDQAMVTGTLSAGTISGTYTSTGACANGDHGNFRATLEPPVAGSWSGTGTSNAGRGSFSFSTTDTEDPNTGVISGSINFSGSPCLSSLTLTGFEVGNEVSVNDPGLHFGAIGFLNATGTQINGTYKTDALCNFDTGSFSMTRSSLSSPLTRITVTPSSPNLQVGQTLQLIATGTFSDGTTSGVSNVSWTSSDPTHVTVSSSGLIKAIANTATGVSITATFGAVSGSTTVTVGQSSTVIVTCDTCSANTISLSANGGRGSIVTLTATQGGTDVTSFATWTSSNPNVITTPAAGVASLVSTGSAIITAATSSGSGSVTITVGP